MDSLLALILYIVGVWFVVTEVVLIGFVVVYRKRPKKRAAWVPGTSLRQLSWVLVRRPNPGRLLPNRLPLGDGPGNPGPT